MLLLSGCAHPRVVRSYDELRPLLNPGDRIEVTVSGGIAAALAARVSGAVETTSADSLTIVTGGARRAIPESAIERLEKLDRVWRRDALIGAAIGGGTGAAIAGFSDCPAGETSCGGTRLAGTAGSALVGAGIGAAVGAKRRPTLVYLPTAVRRPQAR